MGMFKRMKDMRDMVEAAPGMVAQAQQLGAQAREYAAAQQAAMQAPYGQPPYGQPPYGRAPYGQAQPGQTAAAAPTGPDFEPIAGVSLEQFVSVSKGVAAFDYDQNMLPEVAAAKGIPAATWDIAAKGWNERIQANPAVAQRFNKIYRES
jgi:hypothetical protein